MQASVEVAVGVLLFVRYWPSRLRIPMMLCYAGGKRNMFCLRNLLHKREWCASKPRPEIRTMAALMPLDGE